MRNIKEKLGGVDAGKGRVKDDGHNKRNLVLDAENKVLSDTHTGTWEEQDGELGLQGVFLVVVL